MRVFISALMLISLFSFSSCTKTVTQEVNNAVTVTSTIAPSDWKATSDGTGYTTFLNVDAVTQNIVDNGAVLVYASFDGGTTYDLIPEVYGNVSYVSYHQLGGVGIEVYSTNGGTLTPPSGTLPVKIIIVQS
jgi:hypothetical protein